MQYKAHHFITAIPGSRGNITKIADKVGCTRKTVYKAIDSYPTVAEAIQSERDSFKDLMETTIEDQCLSGNTTMLIFYAKTQMRDRGYGQEDTKGLDNTPQITETVHSVPDAK